MAEQLSPEPAPYDALCEAIEDFIASTYQRATPETVPPMIAALTEIRTAVECGIDNLLDTGQLTNEDVSTIWMMGAAHEWLAALRAWEEEHFKPQLELELERLAATEAERSALLRTKHTKRTGIKRARPERATKKAGNKKATKK